MCTKTTFAPNKLIEIKGRVTDETGAGMPKITVSIKGKATTITTDNSGSYNLTKVAEQDILQFSFVGSITTEIAVNRMSTINVILSPDSKSL